MSLSKVHVSGLAVLIACCAACTTKSSNSTATPTSPAGATPLTANSDGSLLKVSGPAPTSPADNTTFDKGVRAATLTATPATPTYGTVTLTYHFQLFRGATLLKDFPNSPAGATVTAATGDLDFKTTYKWWVRAEGSGQAGPWSALRTFTTGEVLQPRRDANAYGGKIPKSVAVDDLNRFLFDVGAAHPGAVNASCLGNGKFDERNSLDFPIELLTVLREKTDNRWGFNCRRGDCNDPSNKIVDYHYSPGPSEGSSKVYVFQVVSGACNVVILDQTDVTFSTTTAGWSLLKGSPFLLGSVLQPNLLDY